MLTMFSDIDGDGRADYCLVWNNGDIHCYRNGGWDAAPAYWQEMSGSDTYIFKGQGKGDKTGVILSTKTFSGTMFLEIG